MSMMDQRLTPDLSEEEERYRRVQNRTLLRKAGQPWEGSVDGGGLYSPAWAAYALSLPVFPNAGPIQNPDGTPVFILGAMGLGDALLG